MKPIELGPLASLSISDIVQALRGRKKTLFETIEKGEFSRTTAKGLGKTIVDNNLLSIDSKSI